MLIRVGDLTRLVLLEDAAHGGGANAIDRVRLAQREREIVEASGADELEAPCSLDVHGAAMRAAPVNSDVAKEGDWQPALDHVAREIPEEGAMLGRAADGVAESRRELGGSTERPQVEVDAGGEDVLGPRFAHPAAKVASSRMPSSTSFLFMR